MELEDIGVVVQFDLKVSTEGLQADVTCNFVGIFEYAAIVFWLFLFNIFL